MVKEVGCRFLEIDDPDPVTAQTHRLQNPPHILMADRKESRLSKRTKTALLSLAVRIFMTASMSTMFLIMERPTIRKPC